MTLDTLAQPIAQPTPGAVRETRSTCCYCGVGCGVVIETRRDANGRDAIVGVRGDSDHPANFGRLCSKGGTLHLTATPERYAQTRATHPELRASRDAARTRVSWDDALDHVAQRLARIVERHGPDAVGFYISGQLLTEDYYVPRAGGAARGEKRGAPQPLIDVEPRHEAQRRVAPHEPCGQLAQHRGIGERRDVAVAQLPAVRETGVEHGVRARLQHRHVVTFACEIVGARQTDDARAQYANPHDCRPSFNRLSMPLSLADRNGPGK